MQRVQILAKKYALDPLAACTALRNHPSRGPERKPRTLTAASARRRDVSDILHARGIGSREICLAMRAFLSHIRW